MILDDAGDIADRLGQMPRAETLPMGTWESFGSNISAGWRAGRDVDNIAGDREVLRRLYAPLVAAVNRNRPATAQMDNPYELRENRADYNPNVPGSWSTMTRADGEAALWGEVERQRKVHPGLFGPLPTDQTALYSEAQNVQKRELEEADKLSSQSGLWGNAAQFLGRAASGTLYDPLNLSAMMVGGGASKSILQTFLREGAVNAGVDAASLPVRGERLEKLGHPMTGGDVATELGGSFLFGGGLAAGMHGAGKLLQKLVDGHDVGGVSSHPDFEDLPPSVRAAALNMEDTNIRAADNPFTDDDAGRKLHGTLIEQTARAMDEALPDILPDTGPGPRGTDIMADAEKRRDGFLIRSFDPGEIETDAKAMQYKGGGDDAGVTDRLSGVKDWDPSKAGLSLIWQKNDGSLVVADGHQRLGLARRAKAAGQNVPYYGALYREADGFTAADMRAIAAFKNIAEGSGTPVDAAQIFRDFPEGISQLPPRSALVREARALSALGDEAYGLVRNGIASERDGAIVGRFVHEPAMQSAILGHLAKDSPDTAEEAEIFVRQALAAGATQEVQTDMFGNLVVANLLLPERVKILKSALKTLRRDKNLFSAVSKGETALADAGNTLNTAGNTARMQDSARAFAVLKTLAERKGAISDALQKAAEESRAHGNRPAAVRNFVAEVRAAAQRGDFDRVETGGTVSPLVPEDAGNAVPAGSPGSADPAAGLDLFADPAGSRAAQQAQTDALAKDVARDVAGYTYTETRGKGVYYNGAMKPVGKLEDYSYNSLNYYGQGLYTTDAMDVAEGYARADKARKNGTAPTIHQLQEKQPVKLYDMEAPLREGEPVYEMLRKHPDDLIQAALEGDGNVRPKNLRELYDGIRDAGTADGLTANDIQETFDAIAYNLEQMGYGGLRHVGGLMSKKPAHDVHIYFNPARDLEISRATGVEAPGRISDDWFGTGPAPLPKPLKPEEMPAVQDRTKTPAAEAKSPTLKDMFGDAAPEVEALRALPQDETMPGLFGDDEITVAAARRQVEHDARATEALRACFFGES